MPGTPGSTRTERKERSMTRLEQMKDTTTRSAIGAALEASRASYEEIRIARDELNAMESGGVYAAGYVEEQREQRADRVRGIVEAKLNGARERVGAARSAIEGTLARMTAVKPDELAAAHATIAMFLGDLRENPEQLVTAYEQSFDVPADRKAIEELVARALRTLPDTPERGMFESKWTMLQKRLEDRLPAKEREPRAMLAELERAVEYLASVEQATTAAIRGLVNPRNGGNLTAYAKASVYEEELAGISPLEANIPMTQGAA